MLTIFFTLTKSEGSSTWRKKNAMEKTDLRSFLTTDMSSSKKCDHPSVPTVSLFQKNFRILK